MYENNLFFIDWYSRFLTFCSSSALRFQITTIEEDLNIGGFTHRRIVPVDPSKPNLTTRETFIYQWLDTEMNPILDSMGPDLRIKFQSPSDFGRYSVRITGLNSGYQRDLSTYITMDGKNWKIYDHMKLFNHFLTYLTVNDYNSILFNRNS